MDLVGCFEWLDAHVDLAMKNGRLWFSIRRRSNPDILNDIATILPRVTDEYY